MLLRDARENDAYTAKSRVIAVPQALETVEFDQSLTAVSQQMVHSTPFTLKSLTLPLISKIIKLTLQLLTGSEVHMAIH